MKKQFLLLVFCHLFFSGVGQTDEEQEFLIQGNKYFDKSETFTEDYDSCMYYTHLAIPYFKKAKAWDKFSESYLGLSSLYYYMGDFDQYLTYADSAKYFTLKYLDKRHEIYAYAQSNLGVFYNRKGDYDKSIKMYNESIEIQSIDSSSGHLLSRTYKNLGKVYQYKRDYAEALKYYSKAVSSYPESGNKQIGSKLFDLINSGQCYEKLNQPESAMDLYQQCLKILSEADKSQHLIKQAEIAAIQNLANLQLKSNDLPKSIEWINQLTAIHDQDNDYNKYHTHELSGKYFLAKNEFNEALLEFEKAIKILLKRRTSQSKQKDLANINKSIGELFYKQNKYSTAIEYYQKALSFQCFDFEGKAIENPTLEQSLYPAEILDVLFAKAQALVGLQKNKTPEAELLEATFQTFQSCKQLIFSLRQDYLANGSKLILAEKASYIFEKAIEQALYAYEISRKEKYLFDAYDSAEQNKAILLLESLNEEYAKKAAGIPVEILEKLREQEINIAFYKKTINLEKQKKEKRKKELIANWTDKLFEIEKERTEIQNELELNYPAYYKLKYRNLVPSAKLILQQDLSSTVIVEYFLGKENSYIFTLDKSGLRSYPILFNKQEKTKISDFVKLVSTPPNPSTANEDFKKFSELSFLLYKTLLEVSIPDIEEVTQLIIIPDGMLSYLPFELLLTNPSTSTRLSFSVDSLNYLFEKCPIAYSYSATHWFNNLKDQERNYSIPFLGLAPFYSNSLATNLRDCSDQNLAGLACSKTEVSEIKGLIGGTTLIGEQANKNAFLNQHSDAQILHLATHACVNDSDAMLSTMHFNDDFLSSYELTSLELNSELTVLSACKSGLGTYEEGEGVFSLARSFIQAGSKSVVMSLWSVNDCSTSKVMTAFYKNLNQGQNKSKALRNAKIDYLKKAKKLEQHPFYWAAFIQLGNTNPLSNQHSTLGLRLSLMALSLLILFLLLRAKL